MRSQEIAPGGSVTLTASATNTTSYQWFRGAQMIEGATAPTYGATSTGSYSCVVTGPGGTARSRAVSVTVAFAPASVASRTFVLSGDFRSVGRDSVDGAYDDTTTETVTIEISENGRSALVTSGEGDQDQYAITYRRSGNRATLTLRGTRSFTDEFSSGSINQTITLNLDLNGHNAEGGFVTGSFTLRGSGRGSYIYQDDNGRTRRGNTTETMTASGTVALD